MIVIVGASKGLGKELSNIFHKNAYWYLCFIINQILYLNNESFYYQLYLIIAFKYTSSSNINILVLINVINIINRTKYLTFLLNIFKRIK